MVKPAKRPFLAKLAGRLAKRHTNGGAAARAARLYLNWTSWENDDRVALATVFSVLLGAAMAALKLAMGIATMSVLFIWNPSTPRMQLNPPDCSASDSARCPSSSDYGCCCANDGPNRP